MHQKANTESIRILVAENGESARILFSDSLDYIGVEAKVHYAPNGVEALSFLKRECKFGSFGIPNLILLDRCLSKMDGKEILMELKQDPQLRDIPIILLNDSMAAKDIEDCSLLGAAGYLLRPSTFEAYAGVVREILQQFSPKIFSSAELGI